MSANQGEALIDPWAELSRIAERLDGAVVALDFDGTLAPLVNDPDQSRPAPGAVAALIELSARGTQVALVTGRDAPTALRLSQLADLPGLVVSGLHGAQRWQHGDLRTLDEPGGIAGLRAELPPLLAQVDPNAWLEDKGLSLVVHTRRSADPLTALAALEPAVVERAEAAGLEVHPGHLVLEIRLPGVSKADAITELLAPDTTAFFYAGDDYGDVPAMAALRRWRSEQGKPALAVGVGELSALDSTVDLRVPAPQDLVTVLQQLLRAH